jgi:hypothetical protein
MAYKYPIWMNVLVTEKLREIKPTEAIFDVVKKRAESELSEEIESAKLDDFEQELDYRETYVEKGKSKF